MKAPPDRLYGRARGHRLRPRQQRLLDLTLPRLRFPAEKAADPLAAFTLDLRASTSNDAQSTVPPGPGGRGEPALWLEVGFGGGEHALAQAEAHPDIAFIACEVFANGICSLLSRLVPEGGEATAPLPPNLRLWPEDARVLLRALPDRCLNRLFLLFPDPWPKSRHAKRRFVHPANLPLLARVLKPGGEWQVASDDPTYQAWTDEVMAAQDLFDAAPAARERPRGWVPTRYEAKALRVGRTPFYWSFRRRD